MCVEAIQSSQKILLKLSDWKPLKWAKHQSWLWLTLIRQHYSQCTRLQPKRIPLSKVWAYPSVRFRKFAPHCKVSKANRTSRVFIEKGKILKTADWMDDHCSIKSLLSSLLVKFTLTGFIDTDRERLNGDENWYWQFNWTASNSLNRASQFKMYWFAFFPFLFLWFTLSLVLDWFKRST